MTKLAVVLAAALVAPVLITPSIAGADQRQDGPGVPPMAEISGKTRGYIKAPPSAFVEHGGPEISKILYVNRCTGGCTFTKSTYSDAITNNTIIGEFPVGTQFTVAEFAQSEQVWNDTLQCLREAYAPYDVQIVTEDPGAVPHHEAVLAGTWRDINRPGVLGVAPLDASTCEPKNNVISFSLANDHVADGLQLCWTIAQESAHSYGLDHAFECTDPMTYIGDNCGQKFFRNKASPCGENGPRDCLCSGSSQNSHAKLLSVHGANATPVPAPTIAITQPANGSTVTAPFSVVVGATDKRGINKLELLVNGWKWAEVPGSRNQAFLVSVPREVPDGVLDLTIRACNDLDICGAQTITVTKGAPCASADACLTGQKCEAGKCFWDPPTQELGDACEYAQQCLTGTCQGLSDGTQICTRSCFAGPNDDCDEGFKCGAAIGQEGVCVPASDDGGGCCSAGGDRGGMGGALAVNLGLGAAVGLMIVRRRRRA